MLLIGALVATGSRTAMAQSEELDQENNAIDSSLPSPNRQYRGEIITSGISGFLTRVEIGLSFNQRSVDTAVEIRSIGSNGFPTDTVLSTGTILAGQSGFVNVPLSPQPYFTAGTQYAVLARTEGDSIGFSLSTSPNPETYPPGRDVYQVIGTSSFQTNNYDLIFRTYAIPTQPTATATTTNTPTITASATATNTPTVTASATPTNTPTNTSTSTPTNTPVPPTNTATNTPTNTAVPPTETATNTPTNTATNTPTNTAVPPTNTATNTPTATATATSTSTLTNTPTATATALPVQLTVIASADSYVQQTDPKKNFGTRNTLIVDGTDDAREVYVRFSVNAAGTIRKAVLRLYVTDGTKDGPRLYQAANSTWTESGLIWNNKPGATGRVLGNLSKVNDKVWIEYDVTSVVTSNGSHSFVLVGDSTESIEFTSREGTNKPQLVLTVQP